MNLEVTTGTASSSLVVDGTPEPEAIVTHAEEVSTPPKTGNPLLEKVLTEKKNAMAELDRIRRENKNLKEAEMVRQNNYQELAAARETELEEMRTKYAEKERVISEGIKFNTVRKELTKLGCDARYLDKAVKFVDLGSVTYDDESGVVSGAELAAKSVAEGLPPLFGHVSVGVNQSAPVGTPSHLTLEQWQKLPYDERKKRRDELNNTIGLVMKK